MLKFLELLENDGTKLYNESQSREIRENFKYSITIKTTNSTVCRLARFKLQVAEPYYK